MIHQYDRLRVRRQEWALVTEDELPRNIHELLGKISDVREDKNPTKIMYVLIYPVVTFALLQTSGVVTSAVVFRQPVAKPKPTAVLHGVHALVLVA